LKVDPVNSSNSTDEKNLWLIRLYYALYFAGMGSISPFLTLFYVSKGLSGTQIGILNSITALGYFLCAPIWGSYHDRSRRPRMVLQIALVLNTAAMYLISRQSIFLLIAAFTALNSLAAGGINPLSQMEALTISSKVGARYGSIRLCGSLGWAVLAWISGQVIQATGLQSGFYLFCGLTLAAAVMLVLLRSHSDEADRNSPQPRPEKVPLPKVLAEIFHNPQLVAYLVVLIVVALTSNGISFESVYLQRLGASKAAIGGLSTLGALVEIPMMLLADRMMAKKGSAITLLLGFIVYVIGLMVIVIHPSISSFVIYRVINGLSFSLYAVSGTYFVVERAPAQQAGTILAFYSVTIGNLLSMVASTLSGALFDLVGPYWLYVIAAGGYAIAAGLIYFMVIRRKTASV
jgi:PPP family 3-phenylpropionic acid transporter